MAKHRQGRPVPSLKLAGTLRNATDPTSPPETPTARKPVHHHQHYRQRQAPFYRFSRPLSQDPNIKPVGNGHQFSYQPVLGPEQLSPRSSSSEPAQDSDSDPASSSAGQRGIEAHSVPASYAADVSGDGQTESDEDSDDDSEGPDSDPSSPGPDPGRGSDTESVHLHAMGALECDFVIEDVDPMDSGCEGLEVLFPTEIESDLDKAMMQDLKNLNCSNEASDNNPCDGDEEAFLQRRQELRRHRRVSMSSSFGKRTHSELSDSDNDEAGSLDANDVGSSARRMHKRLHRSSLLFQDPPEPRIDELDEPDSSEDAYAAGTSLARELPYYTMEIMEMESS